jgi:hypothetical protein
VWLRIEERRGKLESGQVAGLPLQAIASLSKPPTVATTTGNQVPKTDHFSVITDKCDSPDAPCRVGLPGST